MISIQYLLKAYKLKLLLYLIQIFLTVLYDCNLFLSLLMINLHILIPTVIAQILNQIAKLVMLTGTPTNEAKAEIETYPLIAEIKIKVQSNFKYKVSFKVSSNCSK